KASVSA
ncbi:hypothetical protein VCHC17A1_0345, partial [Vibrio cholerae HC-17A1]